MKQKQFAKRLSLNKNTVANLNQKEMNHIFGGETEIDCLTVDKTICVTNCVCPSIRETKCGDCTI